MEGNIPNTGTTKIDDKEQFSVYLFEKKGTQNAKMGRKKSLFSKLKGIRRFKREKIRVFHIGNSIFFLKEE